jgi:hypothetical protein
MRVGSTTLQITNSAGKSHPVLRPYPFDFAQHSTYLTVFQIKLTNQKACFPYILADSR